MTDFGAQIVSELVRYCKEHQANVNFSAAVQRAKEHCQEFLSDLLKEGEKRLPANKAIFQGNRGLHPSKALSQTARLPVSQLPLGHLLAEDLNVIEELYRKIVMHLWREESVSNNEIPDDSTTFRAGIYKYKHALGEKPYKELSLCTLGCLSCPMSNMYAAVPEMCDTATDE